MKYAFIQRHRQVWPITVQCRVLEVSVSGYHGHVARQANEAPRRHLSDDALLVHIKAIHAQTKRAYGRPRLWRELRNNGVRVGKQRLQTLMRKHGIRAKGKKRQRGRRELSLNNSLRPLRLESSVASGREGSG